MRILFVEDDKQIAETLSEALSWFFVVDNAYTGSQALEYALRHAYDLVMLDYSLPDIDGPHLYDQLRAVDPAIKVLVLTGNAEQSAKVSMLDAGADDYVTKPFHLEELLARIRAVLRRGDHQARSSTMTLGDLVMDVAGRTVKRQGQPINLRRKDFDILEYLLRNKGRVVTRDMIINHVWESRSSNTNVIDVHIKSLRDRIDKPYASSLIQTVPGLGYKIDT